MTESSDFNTKHSGRTRARNGVIQSFKDQGGGPDRMFIPDTASVDRSLNVFSVNFKHPTK